jgi:hypothetical protein
MAEDKKSVLVYVDWISIFKKLEDDEAGRLIKHFFEYVNDQNPIAPDRLTELLFEPIKLTLKRDLVKYENKRAINKENILKRWNKEYTTVYDGIKTDTNHTVSDSDRVSDSDIDIIKEKVKRKKVFIKPTIEEIKVYCDERNNGINPKYFFDSNEAKGWVVGKLRTPIVDWKAVIRTWEGNTPNKKGTQHSSSLA